MCQNDRVGRKRLKGLSTPKLKMGLFAILLCLLWPQASFSTDSSALFSEGTKYLRQGRLQDAIAALTRAIDLKPDFAEAYINRGLAYYMNENYPEAEEDFLAVLKIRPDDQKANNNLAVIYYRLERYEEAAVYLDRALQGAQHSDPSYEDIHVNREGVVKAGRQPSGPWAQRSVQLKFYER
jgi:tetratricopeptide (TPR) repeat protein